MFAEGLSGFRQATARSQRTKVDRAVELAAMRDTRYADLQFKIDDARRKLRRLYPKK
jgi:hypothetical protein